jgi:hypothetical protein
MTTKPEAVKQVTAVIPAQPKYESKPDIVFNEKVFRYFESDLFHGYGPVRAIQKGTPWISWSGGKIPLALWQRISAFMKWSYDTHKAEAQVRLYYEEKTHAWAAHAFPQEARSSMTTKELPDHPNTKEDHKIFGGNWIMAGTVHHHCSMAAFQSGTDKSDEQDSNGLHITLGKMDNENEYDIHGRVSFNGQFYATGWQEWFELPKGCDNLSWRAQNALAHAMATDPAPSGVVVPKRWQDNIIEYKYTPTNYSESGIDHSLPGFQMGVGHKNGRKQRQKYSFKPQDGINENFADSTLFEAVDNALERFDMTLHRLYALMGMPVETLNSEAVKMEERAGLLEVLECMEEFGRNEIQLRTIMGLGYDLKKDDSITAKIV